MKVIQLQYSMESAGNSALRLHKAFIENNIDSTIISLKPDTINDKKIKYLNKKARLISLLDYRLKSFLNRKIIKKYGLFSFPVFGTNISKVDEVKSADIIYLHWVLGGFLNISNIRQLAKLGKPIIMVMHDMWYITGGCHYSFTCEKYATTGCGSCQMFEENNKKDLSNKGFNKKINLYSKYENFYFVSPSKWLYDCAKKSILTRQKSIFYIPNAIDDKLFKSFDKRIAKKILNINEEEIVIAFGAVKVNSPYKGWNYLQKALDIFHDYNAFQNVSILIFGSGHDQQIADAIPFKTKFLGYLKDEYSIIIAYNAADVFVAPSLADNQPTTVMESLCCGTAVVGFNIGGIPDMISHKENGYLAEYKNSNDIANGIRFCIENNIKGKVLPSFKKTNIIKKHVDLMGSVKNEK